MTLRPAMREDPADARGSCCFSHYWSNDTWDRLEEDGMEGEPFGHDASGGTRGFTGAGVRPGDVLFAVTVFKGTPYLLAAMEVAEIADRERAARVLGVRPEDLYDAPEHAIASARLSTPMRFGWPMPDPVASALRFLRPSDGAGAKGRPPARARRGDAPGAGRALLRAAIGEHASAPGALGTWRRRSGS